MVDAKYKLEEALRQQVLAETEVNIQIEIQAKNRIATDSMRGKAEKDAKRRARESAKDLQMQAEALSRATTLRISGHMEDMEAVETQFIELKLAEEKE